MHSRFPLAMFVTRRAPCPGCGAPMDLEGTQAQVTCGFCGGTFVVERRLRDSEPDADPARKKITIEWTPSHLNPGQADEQAACWGCGQDLQFSGMQGIVTCANCGSESKIERRTRRLDLDIPTEEGENKRTAALIQKIATSTDLAERVLLAQDFTTWSTINLTFARRVSTVMEMIQTSDPRLAHPLSDGIGKLLCQGDVLMAQSVAQAAPRFIQDPNGSKALIWHIGLGKGLCLKPLLDAADVLDQQGAAELCGTALWAAQTLLGRNYPEHPTLGEIILYRMIYLKGPVLGWALRFAQGQGGIGYRYPTETLLRFIDDCAAERPVLVPELRDSIFHTQLKNESEYRDRLDLFGKLQTAEAKEALLGTLPPPPEGTSVRLLNSTIELLVSQFEDEALCGTAVKAMVGMMKRKVPGPIHKLVKEKGDALPEDVRRAYVKQVPDTPHLSKMERKFWQSEPKRKKDPEIQEAFDQYGDLISRAVDSFNAEKKIVSTYREIIKNRTPLMEAAGRGELVSVKKLIDAGAGVDETNEYGRTALMFAAESGHAPVTTELVARGAGFELRDKDNMTAFMMAAAAGHAGVIGAQLEKADPEHRQEAFRQALQTRKFDVMTLLLESGADPDILEEGGRTPLMNAARDGDKELVRILLKAGADAELPDEEGKTAKDEAPDLF